MQNLEGAMHGGHPGAKYAIGIILMLQGGEHKLNGMQMMLSLKKSTTIPILEDIRKKFLEVIKSMWIRSTMIVGQEMPQCCTKHPTESGLWEPFKEVGLECEDCSCDQELIHLWSILPNTI